MSRSIPYGHQSVSLLDAVRVGKSALSDWLTVGPAVESFEAALCSISGAKYGVAVSSGSAALHCAYAAIDLGPGDEIITSALTFASTATTAINLGATVIFGDIQDDTGNIDPLQVEALITPRTKAVVAIDYAGHPADLDELLVITKRHGIALIEDAAHSLGSIYKKRPVGSIADITTFSFFPTKNVTTGEGGAVMTSNEDYARKASLFRSHGMVREPKWLELKDEGPWHQEIQSLGLNYRLPDILATLGSSQLDKLHRFKAQRRKVWNRYSEMLAGLSGIKLPVERDYVNSMWHLYPLRVDSGRRRDIFEYLRAQGIMVQVNYIPVYWHPFFRDLGYTTGPTPIAEDFYHREISLPIFSNLSKKTVEIVVESVGQAVSQTIKGTNDVRK